VSLESLLRLVADALSHAGIPFMLTGSVAAAYRGSSRATMDIDLVVDPTPRQLDALLARLTAVGMYVSDTAAHDALRDRGMFNVVDPGSGWKVDMIVRKARGFSETEFARRESAELLGVPIAIATLEDLVLSKLEWARLGGSARQLDDVRSLLRLAGDEVDLAYIEHWVEVLDVREQWDAVNG
jgi:hypothetical protein